MTLSENKLVNIYVKAIEISVNFLYFPGVFLTFLSCIKIYPIFQNLLIYPLTF